MHSFLDWASRAADASNASSTPTPRSARGSLPVEKRAIEVAMRLSTYQAYSGDRLQNRGLGPDHAPAEQHQIPGRHGSRNQGSATKSKTRSDMPLFKLDELKAISTYWNNIPSEIATIPTEDSKFDERYAAWLRDNSVWVPLKVFLKSNPARAGRRPAIPKARRKAFLDAYHALEQAESSSPGHCLRTWPRSF